MAQTSTTYRPPGFWQRLLRGNPTETQLAWLLLLPALVTLAVVMLYPVLNVIWQSLHFERLNVPQRGTPFIGLENFREMLWGEGMTWSATRLWGWRLLGIAALIPVWWKTSRRSALIWSSLLLLVAGLLLGFHPGEEGRWNDPRFWNSFQITLLIIVATVTGSFLVGLPLALLANVGSRLRWLVRVALLLPWAMPRVFAGLTFAWLFQSRYGVINDMLGQLGIEGPLWLARVTPAIVAVIIAIVWKTSSFVGLILLAGLQSIDRSLYEAATVDGASAWQRFWRITLPLLRPAIAVALIFRTLTAVQTFDIPYAMTRGGPGRALETLGIYIHGTTLGLDIGYAAALSTILFLLSLGITVVYLRWLYQE
ncbi:MAG TPA: sugar ABC transporter permease [Trueperaceae bacterium]